MPRPGNDSDRAYPDGRPLEEQPQWKQDFPTDVPADQGLARREFTKFLLLTSGAFAAGQCWIAATSSLRPGESYRELRIADDAAVPPGGVVTFRYPTDDDPCVLVRLPDGRLVAYSQQCTHLSCAVIPQPELGQLKCPCHNGYFDLLDGRPTAGPPQRPLPAVALVVRDSGIYATGMEYRTA